MKPKVLHIDSGKTWRGGQQQALYLYEAMHKQGFTTNICVTKGSAFAEKLAQKNLPYSELPLASELDLLSARKVAKIAKQNGYDIIHCHCSHSVSIAAMASVLVPKLKIIATRRVDFPVKLNFFNRRKYLNKNVAKIVCISDAIKQVLLDSGFPESKLVTIHSGIELDKFSGCEGMANRKRFEGKVLVGTVAAFTGDKNYPLLLEAASLIKNQDVAFIALGDGELFPRMQRKAESLGLVNFYFEGFRSDVGEYLKAFDIFVLSSKKEGLGTSVLDAMACGLPIVATHSGGIPEAVADGENGFLVPADNPHLLAERINQLVEDENLRRIFGRRSRELVQKFDIKHTVQKNISLYYEIMSQ